MSFLNATAKLQHISELPAGATLEQGIAALHDHEFFMRCNPIASEVKKLEANEPEAQAALKAITEQAPIYDVEILPGREAETFRIVDVVPNPVWKSDVVSTYTLRDVAAGCVVKVLSPLGIVTDTLWQMKEREDGKLILVEDALLTCSRLLIGMVKGQTEKGWSKIHGNILQRLEAPSPIESENSIKDS